MLLPTSFVSGHRFTLWILAYPIPVEVTACMYWGMVECGVGVVAACLPTIQFLFRIWVWEPAVVSTKSMFSSRTSRTLDSQSKDAIYIDRTFNVAYAEVNGSSSRPTSPEELATIANERFVHDSHPTWDGRVGAAI